MTPEQYTQGFEPQTQFGRIQLGCPTLQDGLRGHGTATPVSSAISLTNKFIAVLATLLAIASESFAKKKPEKPIKDGNISIDGTVASLVDFEHERLNAELVAALGGRHEYVSFRLEGMDDAAVEWKGVRFKKHYMCHVRTREYPIGLEIGDKLRVEGVATHSSDLGGIVPGQVTFYTIQPCRVTSREPGPAKLVTIEGVIKEKTDFPGSESNRPSVAFVIEAEGKSYSCLVEKAIPEFRDYRSGDRISVTGVLPRADTLMIDRCKVFSHTVEHQN